MTPCRICRAEEARLLFLKNALRVVQCARCGFIYTDAAPDQNQLSNLYSESYFKSGGIGTTYYDYQSEERAMYANSLRRLRAIEEVLSVSTGKGRLLDVGCATGVFLAAARDRWDVSGVELSGFAAKCARERGIPRVVTGTMKDARFSDNDFDVVTMWDVVEHLPDPLVDLSEIHRVMKGGGLLVLSTGDAGSLFARVCGRGWHLYNPEQHLSFFSKKSITAILEKVGFRVIAVRKPGNFFSIRYLASCLAMYYPNVVTRSLITLTKSSIFTRLGIYVNLRDIMVVYAAKA